MASFKMTCKCGDMMTVEAADKDAAVAQFKTMMDEKGIAAHMGEKHPGEPLIPVAECHAMIEKEVVAV
ncbi:MAG: hypothetical protein WAP55_03345 [Minisyncoccia bacterium]